MKSDNSSLRGTSNSKPKQSLRLLRSLRSLAMTVSISCLIFGSTAIFAEENTSQNPPASDFKTIEVEIMEVEELKEPLGGAIYTAKDLASGQTIRFFVDPYSSLIQSGGQAVSAGDVLGGSKATIIYRESQKRGMPEIVFALVSGFYY